MSSDLRHHLGRLGERYAADHLERRGFRVIARNHRSRHGELDLVAVDGDLLVFCEVKTSRTGATAQPWDNLHAEKRRQVRRAAAGWLRDVEDRPRAATLRFDAIGVLVDAGGRLAGLEHLEGAF